MYNLIVYYLEFKNKAIDLRSKGKTYSDITRILKRNIPKSTLSEWFKHIIFSKSSQRKLQKNVALKLKKAQLKAKRINAEKRKKYLLDLKNKNLYLLDLINVPIQKIILSILYLAEGSKHKNTRFLCLGSSDPEIIKFYLSLLRACFEIDNSKFRGRIQCRADQNKKRLERFWKRTTEFKIKQFYPTYVDKRTIGKKTLKKNYKGVCVIHYFDTSIQLELELLADSVLKYTKKGR